MEGNTAGHEFRVCMKCGYGRGFHVFFKEGTDGKTGIGLICPNCGQSYDIGWIGSDLPKIEPEKREVFDE